MKKILFAVAASTTLLACQKQVLNDEVTTEQQVITAEVGFDTKLAFAENNSEGGYGLSSLWEEGDQFYAIQDASKIDTFTLVSGAGSAKAKFSTVTTGVNENTRWVGVLGGKAVAISNNEIRCEFTEQTGLIGDIDQCRYSKACSIGFAPYFSFSAGTQYAYILRIMTPKGVNKIEYTPRASYVIKEDGLNDVLDTTDPGKKTITLDHNTSSGEFVYVVVPAIDYSGATNVTITLLNAAETHGCDYTFTKNVTDKAGSIRTIDLSSRSLDKK